MASPHKQNHGILDTDNHAAGTTASPGKTNMIGTNESGALVEIPAEGTNQSTPVGGELVRRTTGGQINLPLNAASGRQAISYVQALELAGTGPWWGEVVGAYADNTDNSITDLVVGNAVINTTDHKIYKVTALAGGNTGGTVTWDAGMLSERNIIVLNNATASEWYYNVDTDEWRDMGGAVTNAHNIDSIDHLVTANHLGVLYTYNASGTGRVGILQLVNSATGAPSVQVGAPLLSGGNGMPLWGELRLGATIPIAAEAVPKMSDLSTMAPNTLAVVRVGSNDSVWVCFKQDSTIGFAVEATRMLS